MMHTSKPSELLHEVVTQECRDAYDIGYATFDGESHFLGSPYFNDASKVGELLGRVWVDGHVKAIIEKNKQHHFQPQQGASQ